MCRNRVKSGKFGLSAKFGLRPCLFHVVIIEIKYKLTKQTVEILKRSGFPLFANICPNLPHVRSYLTLPYCLETLLTHIEKEKILDIYLVRC